MPNDPSIKGTVVAGHAETFQKYLADESPDRATLDRWFEPGEVDVLSGPIEPTRWFPIGSYDRLLCFLREYVGGGRNEFLIESGRRTAEKLLAAGIHQQFEYLSRTEVSEKVDKESRHQAFGRDLRLLTTITGSILNFLESSVVPDPDHAMRWMIRHRQARDYPETLCWTSQGFCNRMAEEHGMPELWYWERLEPGVVCFRMNREA